MSKKSLNILYGRKSFILARRTDLFDINSAPCKLTNDAWLVQQSHWFRSKAAFVRPRTTFVEMSTNKNTNRENQSS